MTGFRLARGPGARKRQRGAHARPKGDHRGTAPPAEGRGPAEPGSAGSPLALAAEAVAAGNNQVAVSYLAALGDREADKARQDFLRAAAIAAAVTRFQRRMAGHLDDPVVKGFTSCLHCLTGDCGACNDPQCRHHRLPGTAVPAPAPGGHRAPEAVPAMIPAPAAAEAGP